MCLKVLQTLRFQHVQKLVKKYFDELQKLLMLHQSSVFFELIILFFLREKKVCSRALFFKKIGQALSL